MTRDESLHALTLLLRLFRGLSTEPIDDEEEFKREVQLRWALWRDQEGWVLHGGGAFDGLDIELHLRKAVLGVRCFRRNPTASSTCVAKMRILLNDDGIVNSSIELTDDADARLLAARLLEVVSYEGPLQPLERSLANGLGRLVGPNDLIPANPGECGVGQ